MVARQFGFVVARAFAVYCWLLAGAESVRTFGVYKLSTAVGSLGGQDMYFALGVGVVIVEVLFGALLWTTAEKFAGPIAEEAAEFRRGDWIVRLVMAAVGALILSWAVKSVASDLMLLSVHQRVPNTDMRLNDEISLVSDGIYFLVGLWLVLTNRFTRYGIAETTEEPRSPVNT